HLPPAARPVRTPARPHRSGRCRGWRRPPRAGRTGPSHGHHTGPRSLPGQFPAPAFFQGCPGPTSRGGPHVTRVLRDAPSGHDAHPRRCEMNTRFRWMAAWFVWILTVALAGFTIRLAALNGTRLAGQRLPAVEDVAQAVASLGFATVGALIASRRANAVGWLLSIIGLGMALFPFSEEYT